MNYQLFQWLENDHIHEVCPIINTIDEKGKTVSGLVPNSEKFGLSVDKWGYLIINYKKLQIVTGFTEICI